jgi:GNAT superfamily N-acetyltransferase/2'-5' RNA ligase
MPTADPLEAAAAWRHVLTDAKERRVRTAEGARRFNLPIGAVIRARHSPLPFRRGGPVANRLAAHVPGTLRGPRHEYFDAEDEDLVGFLDWSPDGDGAYVHYVTTRGDARGRGYARALLNRLYETVEGPVDWGDIEHDGALALYDEFAAREPGRTRRNWSRWYDGGGRERAQLASLPPTGHPDLDARRPQAGGEVLDADGHALMPGDTVSYPHADSHAMVISVHAGNGRVLLGTGTYLRGSDCTLEVPGDGQLPPTGSATLAPPAPYRHAEAEDGLRGYVKMLDQMGDRTAVAVAAHGRWYTPRPLPADIDAGEMQMCFKNAMELAMAVDDLTYVEGFGMSDVGGGTLFPTHHAWCVDAEGNVLDPTWPDGVAFYGVPLHTEDVVEAVMDQGYYGVLGNMPECRDRYDSGQLEDMVKTSSVGIGDPEVDKNAAAVSIRKLHGHDVLEVVPNADPLPPMGYRRLADGTVVTRDELIELAVQAGHKRPADSDKLARDEAAHVGARILHHEALRAGGEVVIDTRFPEADDPLPPTGRVPLPPPPTLRALQAEYDAAHRAVKEADELDLEEGEYGRRVRAASAARTRLRSAERRAQMAVPLGNLEVDESEHQGYTWFKLVEDGRVIATLHGHVAGSTFAVKLLKTNAGHQRRGAASALMDHLAAWTAERGLTINHGERTHDGQAWWAAYSQRRRDAGLLPPSGVELPDPGPAFDVESARSRLDAASLRRIDAHLRAVRINNADAADAAERALLAEALDATADGLFPPDEAKDGKPPAHTGAMVALMLPPDAAAALATPDGEPASELHLTLAYLGRAVDVDRAAVLAATQAAAAAWTDGALDASVTGVARFGAGKDGVPEVYLVNASGLANLRSTLVNALEDAGVSVASDYDFIPHVTRRYLTEDADEPLPDVPDVEWRCPALTVVLGDAHTDVTLDGALEVKDVVRTAEGSRRYGLPIGATIARDPLMELLTRDVGDAERMAAEVRASLDQIRLDNAAVRRAVAGFDVDADAPEYDDGPELPDDEALRAMFVGTFAGLEVRDPLVSRDPGDAFATVRGLIRGRDDDGEEGHVGYFERVFRRCDPTVTHHVMHLDPHVRGLGFARAFNAQAERAYHAAGYRHIMLTAGDEDGARVWAKAGYDWVDGEMPNDVARDVLNALDGYDHLVEDYPGVSDGDIAELGALAQRFDAGIAAAELVETALGARIMSNHGWRGVKALEPDVEAKALSAKMRMYLTVPGVRFVRTAEGARHYGQGIGSRIEADEPGTAAPSPGLTRARQIARAKYRALPPIDPALVQRRTEEAARIKAGKLRAGGEHRGNSRDRARSRLNLFREFGGEELGHVPCVHCGLALHHENGHDLPVLVRDKLRTFRDGGGYQLKNLVPSCGPCNASRGAKTPRLRTNAPTREVVDARPFGADGRYGADPDVDIERSRRTVSGTLTERDVELRRADSYRQYLVEGIPVDPPLAADVDIDAAVADLLADAADADAEITPVITAAVAAAGGELQGLDRRLKAEGPLRDRVRRNLATAFARGRAADVDRAVDDVPDALRYTATFPASRYTDGAIALMKALNASGYSAGTGGWGNSWGLKGYQGLNLRLIDDTGFMFELQIHTPQSYAAKRDSHPLYIEARNLPAGSRRKAELVAEMRAIADGVKAPAGAAGLRWRGRTGGVGPDGYRT